MMSEGQYPKGRALKATRSYLSRGESAMRGSGPSKDEFTQFSTLEMLTP